MTKVERNLIETLAQIVTRMQDEQREYVFIAHALWTLADKRIRDAHYDITRLAEIKGQEIKL